MQTIHEKEREIPVHASVEVLVVGSGPAGLAAAIAAKRAGADVLILERYGCFGGVISQVGVEGFAWYRHEGTIEAGGLVPEFEEMSIRVGAKTRSASPPVRPWMRRCSSMPPTEWWRRRGPGPFSTVQRWRPSWKMGSSRA